MALRNSKIKTTQQIPAFLLKSFELLQKKEYENTISWSDNGNSFTIKDVVDLEKTILPKYFKHDKLASFIRQLNMYGFTKLRNKNKNKVFIHEFFKKGREDLLHKIKRKNPEASIIPDNNLETLVSEHNQNKYIEIPFKNTNNQKIASSMSQTISMYHGQYMHQYYNQSFKNSNININQNREPESSVD